MDAKIKERWATALESGEYAQTKDVLCDGDGGYCCLGVLTDLYAKEIGVAEWGVERFGHDGEEVPCNEVADWAALGERDPWLRVKNGGYKAISAHNDNGGVSFAELAAAIREQL